MKIKYLLSAVATVAFAQHSFAQYAKDVPMFSTSMPGSTARIRAVGNAGTAIGGDLSSVGNNPAGVGFFTRSELSITPEFDGSKVGATYLGNNSNDKRSSINLANASVVFYNRINTQRGTDKTKGWLSVNFGASYNRTNNFYENISFGGRNNNNSVVNYFANVANDNRAPGEDIPPSGTLEGIAYDQRLIDLYGATSTSPGTYRSNVLGAVDQTANIMRTGGLSEVNLALGANYSNSFYIGAALGIADLRYNSTSTFSEAGTASVLNNGSPTNTGFATSYIQDQSTRGTGVNLKLGMIFRPVNAVRIGALLTTPTWYSIDDSYSEGLNTQLTGLGAARDRAIYDFSYKLKTPMKLSGGLAFFLGRVGFITGDIEYMDYSTASVSYEGDRDDNADIKALYKSVVNTRFGAEARLAGSFFLRGGYGIQGNPLKQGGNDIKTISGGIGFRIQNYYIDATYANVDGGYQTLLPYDVGAGTPSAQLNRKYNNAFLTIGLRF